VKVGLLNLPDNAQSIPIPLENLWFFCVPPTCIPNLSWITSRCVSSLCVTFMSSHFVWLGESPAQQLSFSPSKLKEFLTGRKKTTKEQWENPRIRSPQEKVVEWVSGSFRFCQNSRLSLRPYGCWSSTVKQAVLCQFENLLTNEVSIKGITLTTFHIQTPTKSTHFRVENKICTFFWALLTRGIQADPSQALRTFNFIILLFSAFPFLSCLTSTSSSCRKSLLLSLCWHCRESGGRNCR